MSSSAQLALLPWLLSWPPDADRTALAAGLHAGSCAGIAWALRDDLGGLDRHDLLRVGAATVPAAVAGLLAADVVEERLGRPLPTAVLLGVAGLALGAADRRSEDGVLDGRAVAVAALAQCAALVPGVSRSGATLTALRLLRVPREEAQRFSLLLSLPVTAGAAALTLARGGPRPGAGLPVAALVSAVTVRLTRGRADRLLSGAVAYRLGLAATVAVVAARRKSL